MVCSTCDLPLSHCTCPPVLMDLSPFEVVLSIFCDSCGKHIARCECDEPQPAERSGV